MKTRRLTCDLLLGYLHHFTICNLTKESCTPTIFRWKQWTSFILHSSSSTDSQWDQRRIHREGSCTEVIASSRGYQMNCANTSSSRLVRWKFRRGCAPVVGTRRKVGNSWIITTSISLRFHRRGLHFVPTVCINWWRITSEEMRKEFGMNSDVWEDARRMVLLSILISFLADIRL